MCGGPQEFRTNGHSSENKTSKPSFKSQTRSYSCYKVLYEKDVQSTRKGTHDGKHAPPSPPCLFLATDPLSSTPLPIQWAEST